MSAAAPLALADQGFFWVGTQRTRRPQGTVATGQMYVQYQIPANRRSALPLVMVHGGGQGLDYLGTPDGRPGWADFFLRRGYAIYVVDRPGHGRAATSRADMGLEPPPYEFLHGRFVAPERSPAAYPQARLHTQWPGSAELDDPLLDQFMPGQAGLPTDMARVHAEMRRCAELLLDRIGPAVLMTHSAGGPFGWLAADARPALVRAIIAIEPHGPPFAETPFGTLAWGLTASPLSYVPPAGKPEELRRALRKAPHPALKDCFVQADPARSLPNLARCPVLVVTGEASWKAQEDHGVVDFLQQAGVPAEHLRLETVGIHGNGHMMMLERNNDVIVACLAEWLEGRLD